MCLAGSFTEKKEYNMRGVNKVILIGNLGRDPDLQYIEGNIPVAKFPLATTEMRKDKNGNVISETEWHTLVLWRGLAELAGKYLHKGSLVYVEGRLRTRNWEDKDKNRRFQTEVIGESLIMLDKRKDNEHHHQENSGSSTSNLDNISFDLDNDNFNDNLPF